MARYLMALDQGTTSSRAILFDKLGGVAAVDQHEFTQYFPKPSWVEHDANEIWDSQLRAARGVLERAGASTDDVAGIGEATYTQAAGFLKITGGDEPLDATWIHPESYDSARKLLGRLGLSPTRLIAGDLDASQLQNRLSQCDPASLANELNVGLPTFKDILDALLRPGRDPRTDLSASRGI